MTPPKREHVGAIEQLAVDVELQLVDGEHCDTHRA